MKIVPGMVLPVGTMAHLLLRCKKPITAIETADGIEVEPVATMGDRHTYTVRLTSMGEQKVTIRYGEWRVDASGIQRYRGDRDLDEGAR